MILGHDGPAGTYPSSTRMPTFDEDIPLLLVALGERTLELAGPVMDGVVLHTFFSDEAIATSRRRGAAGRRAGRAAIPTRCASGRCSRPSATTSTTSSG